MAKTVDEIADSMYKLVAEAQGLKKLKPMDLTKAMMELYGDDVDKKACKAAIKAGQKLTTSEIEQLLADKEKTECSNRCPHGRPTIIEFSISDLEKQFKRT